MRTYWTQAIISGAIVAAMILTAGVIVARAADGGEYFDSCRELQGVAPLGATLHRQSYFAMQHTA